MAAPSLSDLEPMLASLNQLKPPGASRNKINAITELSAANVQAEQHIAQCMYRALKKAPATHKLGALYVIDSVVRKWIDFAKNAGQDLQIEGRGEPGTYPAAVKRITELMPALMDDIAKVIPADQKAKFENMITIWERANTFPANLLEDFRQKLSEPQPVSNINGSGAHAAQNQGKQSSGKTFRAPIPTRPLHTPVGYPPQRLYDQGVLSRQGEPLNTQNAGNAQQASAHAQQAPPQAQAHQAPAAPPQDVNSILAALANSAPKATPPQPVAQQPPPPPPVNPAAQLPSQLAAMFGNGFPPAFPPQAPAGFPQPPASQPPPFNLAGFQPPPNFPAFPPQQPPSIPQTFAQAPPPPQPAPALAQADPLAPLRNILPQHIVDDQPRLMQALNLLQDLQKGGLPMEHWGPILQAFSDQAETQAPPPGQQQPLQQQAGGYDGYNNGRDRSRSPDRERRAGGRGSPSYGAYEGPDQQDQRNGRGGRDKGRYRQRSPMRNNGGNMPNGASHGPKNIMTDDTLPPNHIRVLSRTLFVGGANGSQQEISELFSRFGEVASCIPNREKRHAFVKMTTREYTLNAKAGVEALQNASDRETMAVARQTKWGVGFGPRECFDYTKGESVIPISRLTEADMKWMLTAEYGGTGGRPLESGMTIEEPDIEIGAGVQDYKVRVHPRKFFKIGKVFLTLHTEPRGSNSTLNTKNHDIYTVALGEQAFSKIRRFIVVREGRDSCSALAISTHSGNGASRRNASEHGIVHTTGTRPPPTMRQEDGLLPSPIRIDPLNEDDRLDATSRMDYGKLYNIEHNVKVKPYGVVNNQSMQTLIKQWTQVFFGRAATPAATAFRSPNPQTLQALKFSPSQIRQVLNILSRRGADPRQVITSVARASAEEALGTKALADHAVELIVAGMDYNAAVAQTRLLQDRRKEADEDDSGDEGIDAQNSEEEEEEDDDDDDDDDDEEDEEESSADSGSDDE